jgi:hypothetical protein
VAIELLELGEQVDRRTGKKAVQWARRRAECHEVLMVRYRDTPNYHLHWEQGLQEYRSIGDHEKIKKFEALYPDVVNRMPVARFSAEIDVTEMMAFIRAFAKELSEETPERILAFLSSDTRIMPPTDGTSGNDIGPHQVSSILDLMNVGIIDELGHHTKYFKTALQRDGLASLKDFEIWLELWTVPMVSEILRAGIEQGKLSSRSFISFLDGHTWLGQEFERALPGRRVKRYKWLDVLEPAIHLCFMDFQNQGPNDSRAASASRVPALDSLILKLEGLLREWANSHGIRSWQMRTDRNGEAVFGERDLNSLLYDSALAGLLTEPNLTFFRFLLVEQAGYNLRNRVAHALLLSHSEYTADYTVMALFALLRLVRCPLGDQVGLSY